jgi:hypothetical protein
MADGGRPAQRSSDIVVISVANCSGFVQEQAITLPARSMTAQLRKVRADR